MKNAESVQGEKKHRKRLIKSKDRVQQHGEVFTPPWMVDFMLDQEGLDEKVKDVRTTILEPSLGEGAFFIAILSRRLEYINRHFEGEEWKIQQLWALMTLYGIELLTDNLNKAKRSLLNLIVKNYKERYREDLIIHDDFYKSCRFVLACNLQQGDALTGYSSLGKAIRFYEWHPCEDMRLVDAEAYYFCDLLGKKKSQPWIQESLFDLGVEEKTNPLVRCNVMDLWKGVGDV